MTDEPYVPLGPRAFLDQFLTEYDLTRADLGDNLRRHDGEYQVHASVLRSHGDFPCAGDREALAFFEDIVDLMISRYGISRGEAVARVNRQWPATEPYSWIVGSSIVYHEDPEFWAAEIYYGSDSRWWKPGPDLRPLPPP